MSSKSVNTHANDFTFPGIMHEYYWEFPTLKISKRVKGNSAFTTWTIYAGIMEANIDQEIIKTFANKVAKNTSNPNYDSNFSFKDFALKLKLDYLLHKPIEMPGKDLCGFTVVDSHHDGSYISFGSITKIISGKNLGRKNATNIFTQALRDAFSKYNKRLCEETQLQKNIILPMLATGEGLSSAKMQKCISEILDANQSRILCQPKYDGIRMMAKMSEPDDPLSEIQYENGLICYSRKGKKIFISPVLQMQIIDFLTKLPSSAILDGELYIHGVHLNDISGYVRCEDDSEEKQRLDYYVFDVTSSQENNLTCFDRLKILHKFKGQFSKINIVETRTCTDVACVMKFYNESIANNFEGLILRKYYGLYEPSDNGYHSKNMIKMKPLFRDEYICIDYCVGTGKSINELILICKLSEQNIFNAKNYLIDKKIPISAIKQNSSFRVKFKNMDTNAQKILIAEFKQIAQNDRSVFENKYKGKLLTIEFQDYSKTCVPLRPNAIAFRVDM
jgi:ATP dependent DNA ligase domain